MLQSILKLTVITILVSAGTIPLHSQDIVFKNSGARATLVELYSSEGCSSCPPAEAWISNLKTSPSLWTKIFPVAFHVDYWDGLGWPDRFAKPAYTQRQRNYAAQLGQDSVYTPEFVTSGREWRGWFHGEQSLPAPTATSGELSLNIKDGGKTVSASYLPASQVGSPAYTVNIALLGVNVLSDVKSGENGGRQLQHDFVVLDFESKPMISGQSFESGRVDLKPSTDDPPGAVVAWVSDTNGSIVQVAGGWLKSSDSPPSASGEKNESTEATLQ
jgi:hypothetical protein